MCCVYKYNLICEIDTIKYTCYPSICMKKDSPNLNNWSLYIGYYLSIALEV